MQTLLELEEEAAWKRGEPKKHTNRMENSGTDAFTDGDLTCDRSDFGKQEGQSSPGFFTFCFKLPTVRKESNIATRY